MNCNMLRRQHLFKKRTRYSDQSDNTLWVEENKFPGLGLEKIAVLYRAEVLFTQISACSLKRQLCISIFLIEVSRVN